MADTALCPDDGMTAGSGTTPRTLPSVRQGCAAARQLLVDLAAKRWNVADNRSTDGSYSRPLASAYGGLVRTGTGTRFFALSGCLARDAL